MRRTVDQVAEAFHITPERVQSLTEEGHLVADPDGRYSEDTVTEFVERHTKR